MMGQSTQHPARACGTRRFDIPPHGTYGGVSASPRHMAAALTHRDTGPPGLTQRGRKSKSLKTPNSHPNLYHRPRVTDGSCCSEGLGQPVPPPTMEPGPAMCWVPHGRGAAGHSPCTCTHRSGWEIESSPAPHARKKQLNSQEVVNSSSNPIPRVSPPGRALQER